ncbi:hypothetical protein AB1Y20_004473 [Prymnesium parvum]|uniref:Protein xylosyltransferase n=1 Tax=Prymnesium parvum TaxID=97485 RepID=A0AB34IYI7_PRYPA
MLRDCQAELNQWCNLNCPHYATHGSLLARYDTNAQRGPRSWRCYAESTLTSDLSRYSSGDSYCTRHPQLLELLESCRAMSDAYRSEVAYGPGGARADAPGQCADAAAECALWARYGECEQNMHWMLPSCPVACGVCAATGAAGGGERPPPAAPGRRVDAEVSAKARGHATPRAPPSPPPVVGGVSAKTPPPAVPLCESACAAAEGQSSAGCSGRGMCTRWNGYEWCSCGHTANTRYVGFRCGFALKDKGACGAACEAHGTCVNGFCECDHGWHGRDCETAGQMPPFLSKEPLRAAGLATSNAQKCYPPSYHQAFARNSTKMELLLNSITDKPHTLKCSSCALVSNAGSLLDSEYGKAIDANECVFRMNRGPTKGFERHVGRKTTFDFVNSFPHLRNPRILPRLDTVLLHGTTTEMFDPKGSGFEKYMGWVSGHVDWKRQHPELEAHVLDIEWMMRSWEAYWAYLASWKSPLNSMDRPSSGWHIARLALQSCEVVRLYGFSMASDKFHYFDSFVQETVTPTQRDIHYGITHRFAWEHEVFRNWTKQMPGRVELFQ